MISLGCPVTFQLEDESKRRYGRVIARRDRQGGFFIVYRIRCTDGSEFEIHEITKLPIGGVRNVREAANSLHFILAD